MVCYLLTINNSRKLHEGSREGVGWMFPQLQETKETSVGFNINKIIQGCVEKVNVFKCFDEVGTPILNDSTYYIVLNTTLDFLSFTTHGSCNFRGESHILLYLKIFKHGLYAGRELQRARNVTEMIYPHIILSFFDKTK